MAFENPNAGIAKEISDVIHKAIFADKPRGTITISTLDIERKEKEAEEKIDREVSTSFARQNIPRPKEAKTSTPNSGTPEAVERLNKTEAWLSCLNFFPPDKSDDLKFLLHLCHTLIFERFLVEGELDTWRKRCDDLLLEMLKNNLHRGTLRY